MSVKAQLSSSSSMTCMPPSGPIYDTLLAESTAKSAGLAPEEADAVAREVFAKFPDTWEELRAQDLIYCEYIPKQKPLSQPQVTGGRGNLLQQLVHDGFVEARPITYEDFLPISAAGIFHSNLAGGKAQGPKLKQDVGPDREGLEQALGSQLRDQYEWYEHAQQASLELVSDAVGVAVSSLTS